MNERHQVVCCLRLAQEMNVEDEDEDGEHSILCDRGLALLLYLPSAKAAPRETPHRVRILGDLAPCIPACVACGT